MDSGAHRLHLAHALPDGNGLFGMVAEAVCILVKSPEGYGHGGCSPQGLHERLVLLHIADQTGGEAGEGLTLCLIGGENLHRLEQGNFHSFLIYDDVPVRTQHRGHGVRVQPHFLNLPFQGRGCNDGQALLPLLHMPPGLFPFVEARHRFGGMGTLHVNEDRIIDGIAVKPGHCAEVVKKPLTLKELLDILLNPQNNFLHPFPVGWLVSHDRSTPFLICNGLEPCFWRGVEKDAGVSGPAPETPESKGFPYAESVTAAPCTGAPDPGFCAAPPAGRSRHSRRPGCSVGETGCRRGHIVSSDERRP